MKIESKDFKIENIFNGKKYKIPDYQRNYSWSVSEEILVFWDDFLYYLNYGSASSFFIGPMVFKGEDTNSSEFEVIDGQQRLITFSIFLSVIVALFKKYGEINLSDGLRQCLVYKDKKNIDQLAIETLEPHPFFQSRIFHADNVIKPKLPSEILIEQARVFFECSLEELLGNKSKRDKIVQLEKIRDYVFNIDTVIIVSDNETDAFTIFETINTRGKDLSSLDLLKNYIFKEYPSKTGIQEPKKTWKELVENIDSGKDFFNRFWASWIAKVSENKLYRRFNDYMRDNEKNIDFPSVNILLDELLLASKIHKKITKPVIDDWKKNKNYHVYNHIKNINGLFNLKVHFPFFLALFEEFEKKNIDINLLNKTLLIMENFHFVFTHIVSPRASGLDNKYSKFAIRLRKEKDKNNVIAELRKELLDKIPKKAAYIEKFKELNFNKHKDTIKFILLRLEKEKDTAFALNFELNSIEHLEPKSGKVLNVNNIGNLFLLEEEYNREKGNLKPFDLYSKKEGNIIAYLGKKTKYKTTKGELKKIEKSGKWTKEDIDERTDALAKATYSLFSKL